MKILFTVAFLDGLHGSVIYIKEIATFLASPKGGSHSISVMTIFATPEIKLLFKKCGLNVCTLDDIDFDTIYDIVFAYHFPTINTLISRKLKCKKLILGCLSSFDLLEIPPLYYDCASLILAVSSEAKNNLVKSYNIPSEKISVMENLIPDNFLYYKSSRKLENKFPKRIAVVSTHIPREIFNLKNIISNDISIEYFGSQVKSVEITPQLLAGFDIIITIGKTVLYALGLGIPVYEYDIHGGNGFIRLKNIHLEVYSNFSGRPQCRKLSSIKILDELLSQYEYDVEDVNGLKKIALQKFSLSKNINNIIKKISSCDDFKLKSNSDMNIYLQQGVCFFNWALNIKRQEYTLLKTYRLLIEENEKLKNDLFILLSKIKSTRNG